jgi:hypothetical protein
VSTSTAADLQGGEIDDEVRNDSHTGTAPGAVPENDPVARLTAGLARVLEARYRHQQPAVDGEQAADRGQSVVPGWPSGSAVRDAVLRAMTEPEARASVTDVWNGLLQQNEHG